MPPLKWCKSLNQFLYHTFSVRKVPLTYIICDEVEVDLEDVPAGTVVDPDMKYDPLEANKAFGASGSVLDDIMKRLSHNHPL